ncbi:MAG: type II toxin-antitoxin system HicB family antitoxin [Bdellovibrionales bacterium]|nr:type II toxin-antitoxin system HicB family antitoxin [Bdellovibrionales bacterium]
MKYHFKVKKEKKGYSAVCIELRGCVTQGDDSGELHQNMAEALNLYIDEPSDSRTLFPMPRQRLKGRNVVEVALEPRIAFAFALRMTRLKAKLTQREVAEKIGIQGSLNNYQRLENSDTANPVLETLVQIKRAFPDFPLEQIAS